MEPGETRRVLIVDDNEDSARTLGWIMEALGHEAKTASNGPTALHIAEAFKPDVVLLDIGLPQMDGYQVCAALRKTPAARNAVIIAQTGWNRPGDLKRADEAGFDDRLVKPIDIKTLQQAMSAAGRRRATAH